MGIRDLVNPHILELEPYTPGTQPEGPGWIKLNTNELPYEPPQAVLEAIRIESERLARYPNPTSSGLREALAEFHGLEPAQVIVGNGSDDILNLLARAFSGVDRSTFDTSPSYSLYPVLTAIAGGKLQSIPFGEDFELPVSELCKCGADLLFLTSPNAPTGVQFPIEQLRELAAGFSGILVIDEAYAEFANGSAIPLLAEFEHVVITRTFSKAYGLAGLRVGYALTTPEIVGILDRIRDSYNVNRLSQAGAIAALKANDVYSGYIAEIRKTREKIRTQLEELGWKVYPSEANFLFGAPVKNGGAPSPELAASLFRYFLKSRILVRTFPKHPLTASYLRVSIGSPCEMERFIEEVRKWTKTA
ncbi:MAG: histidinol-phosphate transaminase [Puniceicoccaceae bacterium]